MQEENAAIRGTRLPRFAIGRLVATPTALEAFARNDTDFSDLVDRHIAGDWGDLSAEDSAANDIALVEGDGRLFSAYHLKDKTKVWIITEADRSSTCILLPEEY